MTPHIQEKLLLRLIFYYFFNTNSRILRFIMSEATRGAPARGGGFGSRGDRGGDRGRGRGGRGRGRRGAPKSDEKEWQPVTKLGRLVKAGKIKSMEEIYLHSLPIKEYQIVDFFLPKLKDEVMKVDWLLPILHKPDHGRLISFTKRF